MKIFKKYLLKIFLIIIVSNALISCASRPKLYPNHTLKSKGKLKAESDIDGCLKEADLYLDSPQGKKIAKGAGFGAMVGGAVGAVAGVFTGNITRGAAQGAAMGGAGGGTASALSPSEIKQQFVNQCLSEKGYQILGWD